jgi:hypothetical protein
MFSASLQAFIDTPNCVLEDRCQHSTVHIPNVFCDGYLQTIYYVGIVIIKFAEIFDNPVLCVSNYRG